LALLHSVGYSLVKAKFCVLYPTLARSKPSPLDTLEEGVLEAQVDAALQDLLGYEKAEQAKLAAKLL
jgi:hypothetical protein